MGETNSPSVAHVGCDISPLSRVKLKILKSHTSIVLQNYDFLSQCVIIVPEPITKSPMIKFTVVNEIFIQVCNAYMSSFIDRVHSDTFG